MHTQNYKLLFLLTRIEMLAGLTPPEAHSFILFASDLYYYIFVLKIIYYDFIYTKYTKKLNPRGIGVLERDKL